MYPQKVLRVVSAASLLLNAQPSAANPNCKIAHVEGEYAYLLPLPFEGNLTQDFVGGTSVQNKTVASSLANAQTSPFVSYSKEFDDLLGAASLVAAVPEAPFPFTWAGEAGVWVPDHDQVWFVSTLYGGPTALYILFLNNNTVIKPELRAAGGYGTHIPLANPAGGYYFNGTVYLALVGDEREPSSLVAVDPDTFVVTPLVNSYFGLELPPVDDVVVTYANTSQGVQRHIVSTHASFEPELVLYRCPDQIRDPLVFLDARSLCLRPGCGPSRGSAAKRLLDVHPGDQNTAARHPPRGCHDSQRRCRRQGLPASVRD